MAKVINLKSSIETIDIQNEEGKPLVTIEINTSDDSYFSRFMDLYDDLGVLVEKVKREIATIELKEAKDSLNTKTAKKILEINTEAAKEISRMTDELFGEGFTRKLFAEHYELNPQFSPNIKLFQEFYTGVMPVIQDYYKDSIKKYSVKKGR